MSESCVKWFNNKASALLNLFGKKTKPENKESNEKIEIIGDGRLPESDLVSAKVDIENSRFANIFGSITTLELIAAH